MNFDNFLEKIAHTKTARQALTETQQYFLPWGVVGVAYTGRHIPQPYLYSGRNLARWSDRYSEQGYISIDPTIIATRHSLLPIAWSAANPANWFSDQQRALFADAAVHGQENGLLVPFREEAGGVALVAYFFGTHPPITDSERKALLVMAALHIHERVKVSPARPSIPECAVVVLSSREKECLAGIQEGLTYAKIGQRLGITGRTVMFHLHNCRDKLGASTVAHASALALQHGFVRNELVLGKPTQSPQNAAVHAASDTPSDTVAIIQWKIAQMGEMLSALAHHWRQPLTAISLAIQNILEEYKANELTIDGLEQTAAAALSSVGQLSQTIFDITSHSYLRDGLHMVCALQESIEIAHFLLPELKALHIELTGHFLKQKPKPAAQWKTGKTHLLVKFPIAGLRQVIGNLLANARDAIIMKRRAIGHHFTGSIQVSIKIVNDFVVITVEDNGGGIQSGALKRIFEPFFTTKERCVGTGIISGAGLGLYQAKLLVEAQAGGTIDARNGVSGAAVTVTLPIANIAEH